MNKIIQILILLSLLGVSCSDSKQEKDKVLEMEKLKTENDSLKTIVLKNKTIMKKQMIRSLTFQDGNAEKAMNFYVELFSNSKVINITRWGKGAPTEEGKIMQATFELDGNLFMCSDSPPIHAWNFTPAVSNYIECENETEIETLFSKLSANGKVMMELANYGFSEKFAFIEDQFGVSWQLNLN